MHMSEIPPWDKNGQQVQKNSTNGQRDEKKVNAIYIRFSSKWGYLSSSKT